MALLDDRLGKSKDAEREYRRALALSHGAPAELNSYGVYLCSHGRADEGVRYLEEAAANPLYNTPWAAYTNAGVCLQGAASRRRGDGAIRARAAGRTRASPKRRFTPPIWSSRSSRYTEGRLRIDLYLLSHRPTPDLLLLGWRIASRAEGCRRSVALWRSRSRKEFPDSTQAREVAIEHGRRGS